MEGNDQVPGHGEGFSISSGRVFRGSIKPDLRESQLNRREKDAGIITFGFADLGVFKNCVCSSPGIWMLLKLCQHALGGFVL